MLFCFFPFLTKDYQYKFEDGLVLFDGRKKYCIGFSFLFFVSNFGLILSLRCVCMYASLLQVKFSKDQCVFLLGMEVKL